MNAQQIHFLKLLNRTLYSGSDTREVLNRVLELTLEFLDLEAGALLINYPAQTLNCIAISGFADDKLGEICTILELAFNTDRSWGQSNGNSRVVLRPSTFSAIPVYQQLMAGEGIEDFRVIYLPALNEIDDIKGVLSLFASQEMAIEENEQGEFLELLGYHLGAALQLKELRAMVDQSTDVEEAAYDSTVRGLVKVLDIRDSETEEHALRVANLAVRLGKKMGLPDKKLLRIRRGALLHDIGKIAISDKILRKPGSLIEREWQIMRKHPEIALDILSKFSFLQDSLDIPFSHHERWDGNGYPRGLRGEEIPLVARIFAIVDVWDALRSDRPYRDGWTDADVIDYISSESGKHFDPKVVDAFLEVIGEQATSVLPTQFELLT